MVERTTYLQASIAEQDQHTINKVTAAEEVHARLNRSSSPASSSARSASSPRSPASATRSPRRRAACSHHRATSRRSSSASATAARGVSGASVFQPAPEQRQLPSRRRPQRRPRDAQLRRQRIGPGQRARSDQGRSRGRQPDPQHPVHLGRRPRLVQRPRLRLLGIGQLRTSRRRRAQQPDGVGRIHELGRSPAPASGSRSTPTPATCG